jgi:PIN domain nuclease of toxin-antitoxin system
MLILDTHIWLWLINGDPKIKNSGLLLEIIKAARKKSLLVPAICPWEVSMLVSKNRIELEGNTLDWINKALSAPGINLCPLTPDIAYESVNLPGDFHGDPADRMIVASARKFNGTLVTFDKKILEYSEEGHVKILKPQFSTPTTDFSR